MKHHQSSSSSILQSTNGRWHYLSLPSWVGGWAGKLVARPLQQSVNQQAFSFENEFYFDKTTINQPTETFSTYLLAYL
jgi:hypothetical protein